MIHSNLKIQFRQYTSGFYLKFCCIMALLFTTAFVHAQNIPQHISYTRIYDYLDELATDGIIDLNSVVKPYSRDFIAERLLQAKENEAFLNRRQRGDLYFFLNDYALERDTLPASLVHWSDKKSFDLSLIQPQFLYNSKHFKMQIRPIIGMDVIANQKGIITKRFWGGEIQIDIVDHLSVWGSLRDFSFNGEMLNDSDYPSIYDKIDGAKLSKPSYINTIPGAEYKEANYGADFSEFRGGIKAYTWWGSIGFLKDNLVWGDTYKSSNIISDQAPSFPMISLNLTPCKWFEFNYIHGYLISNVIDSSFYYVEEDYSTDESKKHYRPMNKFIAANMFTFTPIKNLNLSFGNSIIYAEESAKAIYFIPFAFFKSLDHLLTKGLQIENQNSQMFLNISSRNIKHLHLYASLFVDEFKLSRLESDNPESNLISYKAGFNLSNWPIKNVSVGFEYTRSNILTYKHSIQSLTWASNSYNLGHYAGDNAQEFYLHMHYKPIKSLKLDLSYTNVQKGKNYSYIRDDASDIISQEVLEDISWQNNVVAFKATYEIWNNAYAVLALEYNHAQGYELTDPVGPGENRLDAQGYLDLYTPVFYQGENLTVTAGFSIGF